MALSEFYENARDALAELKRSREFKKANKERQKSTDMKYSTAMIHSGSGGAQGTYEQMEEQQKNYKKLIDAMRSYIMERTNIDLKLFNKNKTKDWYITDAEQVELGIVDSIVSDLDEIL